MNLDVRFSLTFVYLNIIIVIAWKIQMQLDLESEKARPYHI